MINFTNRNSNTTVHGKLQSFFPRFLLFTENASIGGPYNPLGKEWLVGFGLLGEQGAESINTRPFQHVTKDLPLSAR